MATYRVIRQVKIGGVVRHPGEYLDDTTWRYGIARSLTEMRRIEPCELPEGATADGIYPPVPPKPEPKVEDPPKEDEPDEASAEGDGETDSEDDEDHPEPTAFDPDVSIPKLRAFAEEHGIELGALVLKADIVATIETALEQETGDDEE